MGWTAPRTWTDGDTVPASALNTDLRDNLLFIEAADQRVKADPDPLHLSSESWTAISCVVEDYDTSTGMHSTDSSPTRFVCTESGIHLMAASIALGDSADSTKSTQWRISENGGDTTIAIHGKPQPSGSDTAVFTLTGVGLMEPGDYWELEMWHNGDGDDETAGAAADYPASIVFVRIAGGEA